MEPQNLQVELMLHLPHIARLALHSFPVFFEEASAVLVAGMQAGCSMDQYEGAGSPIPLYGFVLDAFRFIVDACTATRTNRLGSLAHVAFTSSREVSRGFQAPCIPWG